MLRDIAEFAATGEFHDTAGALDVKFSGGDDYVTAAINTLANDAKARGDTDAFQKLQTQLPSFKKFFAGSKVVDANGEPLVVWHGTPNGDFTVFDKQKIGSTTNRQNVSIGELGFYFTNDKGAAQNYAEYHGTNSDPRTMGVYLSLRNPLIVEDSGWGSAADQADARKNDLARWAKKGGHDGIIVRSTDEILDDGSVDTVYIAFEPNQVKSATDNIGTFDPGNDDIRFSRSQMPTVRVGSFRVADADDRGGRAGRGQREH